MPTEKIISLNNLDRYDKNLKTIAGILQRNTEYALGDVVHNKNIYLKCTTAGTTKAETLDLSSATKGASVTDGTVIWTVTSTTGPAIGESSGAGLEDWQANYGYKAGELFVYNGQIYKVLNNFTSGATFEETSNIEAYVPPGGGVVAEQEVLYEGNIYETDLTGRYTYTISDITDYDFLVISFEVGQVADGAIQPVLVEQKFIKDAKITDNTYRYEYAFEYMLNISKISVSSFSGWLSFPDSTHILFAPRTVGENSDNLGICLKKIEGIKFVSSSSQGINYSTEEQRIGTWIDGKPLYQKTYVGTIIADSALHPIATLSNNLSVVDVTGYALNSYGSIYPTNVYISGDDRFSVYINSDNAIIIIATPSSGLNSSSCYITVKYTKTTDGGGT